jgi:hypothetical protein
MLLRWTAPLTLPLSPSLGERAGSFTPINLTGIKGTIRFPDQTFNRGRRCLGAQDWDEEFLGDQIELNSYLEISI